MAAAADGFFRNVYEGCISGCDSGIERRPYHRNCSCALHSKSNNNKSRNNCHKCNKNVSYPMRRAWSEGSLLVMAAADSSYSSSPSSSSSPALERLQLGSSTTLRIEEEDDDHDHQFSLFIKMKELSMDLPPEGLPHE
ncbi:hypothetical protein EZV62_012175 [Acer yangbiense]|uniref:Uncharacterized protein n=1 Tax=Acer yangbiense TaxID=1000413 RepID=A0A5C7HXC5_9ROSI|nr:hypothetical protein EZV62_012175 [Acer yangbiense]